MSSELCKVLGDLHRKLASRRQHDGLRAVELGIEALDQWDTVRGGLAGAGQRLRHHVLALEQQRNALRLHRRGLFETNIAHGA